MSAPLSFWTNDEPRLHLSSWEGAGQPLMLVHGMAGNSHWWDKAAPLLAAACAPVALDLRGHGDSGWRPDGRYDTASFIADIEQARHALGWSRMALCGHSLGARVALEYARAHPQRLSALIAVDFMAEPRPPRSGGFARARRRSQPYYDDAGLMERRFRLQPPGTTLSEEELRTLARNCLRPGKGRFTWKCDWRCFSYEYEPVWDLLPKIQTPTLLIRGALSSIVSEECLKRMAAALPGGKAATIAGAHHHVPLDAPRPLARTLLQFLGG